MLEAKVAADRVSYTLSEVALFQEKLRLAAAETGINLDDRKREVAIGILEEMKGYWSGLPPVRCSEDELAALERMEHAFRASSLPYVADPAERIVSFLRTAP